MKQKLGMMLFISGILLLVQPNFDIQQMFMNFNYIVANYWPLALLVIGYTLMQGNKKRVRQKR